MATPLNDFTAHDFKFFTYSEVQNNLNSLSELMSYEELTNINPSLPGTAKEMFVDESNNFNDLCEEKKVAFIRLLMDQLETVNESLRMEAAHTVLYIVLGCVHNPVLLQKVNKSAAENTMLLFRLGTFPLLVNILNMERMSTKYRKNAATQSNHICVILNILTLIAEQMLNQKRYNKYNKDVEIFIEDCLSSEEKDSLLFILLDMMTEFASSEKPGYPIKKIIILIWKIIMISFGGLKDLIFEKQERRAKCGLDNDHSNELDINSRYELPLLQKVSKKDFNKYVYNMSFKNRDMKDTIATESIESLQKHLYIPLSELQLEGTGISNIDRIETLYENMLPKMKVYIESLFQIFRNSMRIPVLNMFGDCNEEIMTISSYNPLMILGKCHIFENMEIINKAISGILLLLLKHFKLNHIYQFEHFSQVMVSSDAIPLMKTYLERTSELFIILKKSRNQRNLFTCVNVLRIVNKLIKGKYWRTKIFMKVNVKHLNHLTSLNNKHLEVYSLKLLKILSKLLGRRWRQENMNIMNKIFQNLRQRLLEDSCTRAQNNTDDEEMLKRRTHLFNRQYSKIKTYKISEYNADRSFELTDFFKIHYKDWLEEEVFQNPIDWDSFLNHSEIML